MDYEKLKISVKKIEMSDEMRARIIRNCQSKTLYEAEEITMNKSKTNRWFKKPVSVAAVVSLCLCFTVAAAAAGYFGFFKDITNWNGAIVGTQYEQASDEIEVTVACDENEITVCAVMVDPTVAPYSELETFGIESYKIIDMSGKVIVEGEEIELVELVNGKSNITIPLDNVGSGDYRLVITAFVGAKKADQPLQFNGKWECEFSL